MSLKYLLKTSSDKFGACEKQICNSGCFFFKISADFKKVFAKKYNSKSKISYNKLKELGYINNLKDENDNECDGYVLYDNNTYTAYINCENYITDGYYANKNK